VERLRIDPVQHVLHVAGGIDDDEVRRTLADLGMTARPMDAPGHEVRGGLDRTRLALAVVAGLFWAASLAIAWSRGSGGTATVLAIGAVVSGGWYVFPRGWTAVRNRALDMNFLMSAAALGALAIGEPAEAASVMFLFAVAQLLETASMARARRAIRSLMELAPAQATVVRGGDEVRVPAETVAVGETVLVRPGERVPVDGRVTRGRSSVDQATITGESVPVAKEEGDDVFAGTVNGEGVLHVRSTHAPGDTTIARIIHSVEEAQASRAPSQAFVDRFARVYTPAVVATAVLVAVLPPLVAGGAWNEWIYRALALLVVACPCALVISTPVTVVSALAGAARRGILIKGGLHLETAGRARVVALDKTGTLTEGRPEVVEVVSLDGTETDRILALAAAVEQRSEHPLAAAVVERARRAGLSPPAADGARALPGRGAEGRVDGARIVVGSPRLFREEGAGEAAEAPQVVALEARGLTVVLVGRAPRHEGAQGEATSGSHTLEAVGALALADRPRNDAAGALAALRHHGIGHVAILTGDHPTTAAAVARALGQDPGIVAAGLLPADKVAAVGRLRDAHGTVLMVGDGVNDAPALAAADVGVAMGAAGTDVALETADIALMADDLSALPVLVRLARKAEAIIRTNIAFALLVKAVFVVLAVTGWATLWMAVLADMGASLLVIGNGMRALSVREG
jgi:Cd2+/Zn2+-exporting ATPase